MRRLPLASVLACPALALAADAVSVAPERNAAAAEPAPVVSNATPTAPATPRPMQLVSAQTAARLTANVPKFTPPPPDTTPRPGTAVAAPALPPEVREPDRPRNTILRLPEYVVREEKLVLPKPREVLTPRGKLDLALKRHPGLRLGSFWIFRNDAIALFMLAEEERLERKAEFEDLARLMTITDPAAGETVKREVEKGFMREPKFGR